MFKYLPFSAVVALMSGLLSGMTLAETIINKTQTVVIIGNKEDAQQLPGSAAVIDNAQIDIEVTTDINQVLKTVPGVYIREEDGSGLRPNIGIRGATGERSSNVTLLEDGIMISPAPYTNPAAYYFPTPMRMHSVEVLKGAPLLRYGPQTTGGVINMVSTPVPDTNSGSATIAIGTHGSEDLHVNYGGNINEQWSWLMETVQRNNEGYKDIDNANRDSGFDISDYVFKLGWESAQGPQQQVLLKLQSSDEVSNETYLGLADDDFAENKNRRYGLTGIDQMTNDHQGASLFYSRELSDKVTASATLYRNQFARDWFKLAGGAAFIDLANADDTNAQGILDGTVDVTGLKYKHNNREYISQGLEVNFDIIYGLHMLQIGGRIHEDEVDRFQITENYDQVNGSLVFQSLTLPGSSDNRVATGNAQSFWIQDNWQITDTLNAVLSLRYEDVETEEVRYSALDRSVVDVKTPNDTRELLPGISFTYDLNTQWQMLAGLHKGFSPLGAGTPDNQSPETSRNWELGARFREADLFVEVIGFYSNFDNKVEHCSVGTPCSNAATSGSFKTGEAVISGIETQLGTQLVSGAFTIPVALAYTYTQAEISTDNAITGVEKGDKLKDVPENTFSTRLGLEHSNGWNNYLIAKYIDETCVAISCNRNTGAQAQTDSLFVIDYVSRFAVNSELEVFFKAENILDEQKIVSRDPEGARPNKPLSIAVGMKLDF